MALNLPLMHNNITREDLDVVIEFLKGEPILTQSKNVVAFEQEWSQWLGVKYSVFLNSGSSANILTMAALRYLNGPGEVIVPTLTWVSDVCSVLYAGFKPVFVDIDMKHLGMAEKEILKAVTPQTKAVFLTHVLGFNGLSDILLKELESRGIPLIEDVCESHGATHKGRKLGSYGYASNFSFYYAHHMSTIEGGMVCTNDEKFYQVIRMLRGHGMLRESTSDGIKQDVKAQFPDLNPDFIFVHPGYNMRSTEVNAVMGRHQLKRLDSNNEKRRANFRLFLSSLDPKIYYTDYTEEGSCNYAFTLLLKDKDTEKRNRLENLMRENKIEFRRGMSGGGSQVRQPYLKQFYNINIDPKLFPNTEHVHFFGYYIGNYPDLPQEKIKQLCTLLNSLK
jgi:CDP-6-deoxy-D-xylo-4-hexulose-3-dehydrase